MAEQKENNLHQPISGGGRITTPAIAKSTVQTTHTVNLMK